MQSVARTVLTGPSATLTVPLARLRHPAVGRNRIYRAIASGALEAVRVGKRYAIDVNGMDLWVARGCPVERTR